MVRPPASTTPPPAIDAAFEGDTDPTRVLHVDDDQAFAALTAAFLERVSDDIEVVTEHRATDAIDRLGDEAAPRIECVVSDYQMPGMDGLAFLERVRERHADLPFILFTGKGSEEVASDAISAGVTDYLQKEVGPDQYTVLANRIQNVVRYAHTERTIEQLLSAIETVREGISLLNEDGRFVYVNRAFADVVGYDQAAVRGEDWSRLLPEDEARRLTEEVLTSIPDDGVWRGDVTLVRADGTRVRTEQTLSYTPSEWLACTISASTDRNA